MTQAMTWGLLRDFWLQSGNEMDADVQSRLKDAMKLVAPTACDDPKTGGDSGDVYFSDGSTIKYDWDNGDFECEGVRLQYPYYSEDPLWWKD